MATETTGTKRTKSASQDEMMAQAQEMMKTGRKEIERLAREGERFIKDKPVPALLGAIGAGYLLGRRPYLLPVVLLGAGIAFGMRLPQKSL